VSTPAYNVNRLCSSGLQAIWSGIKDIQVGDYDLVVAGGDENMTQQPFFDYSARNGSPLGDRKLVDGTLSLVTDPWGNYPMGETAERVADRFGISRERQDAFALRSQEKAAAAIAAGLFAGQIVEVGGISTDEHPRGTTIEKLGGLKTVFRKEGTVTAGNASGINDGGAAVVLESAAGAERAGRTPLARFVGATVTALEPEIMGFAPASAVKQLMAKTGISLDAVDVIELNEAFAAQVLAVIDDLGIADDDPRLNPEGGAIALGHPIGATGAILTIKAIDQLHRTGGRYGLVTMCIGGGQGMAALFERV
jgi:acetyl-CoA C-acetyltransferase